MIEPKVKMIKALKKQEGTPSVNHLPTQKKHYIRWNWLTKIVIGCLLLVCVTTILPTIIVQFATYDEVEVDGKLNAYPSDGAETISVKVLREATGEEEIVELEDYVYAVVASEMPASFEEEALKAQAVAARTYVIQQMYVGKGIITDTTADQVYKNNAELEKQWGNNYEEHHQKIKEAVQATSGEIILYDNEPITPTFFSMSNGYTENAEDYWESAYPYLKSVESKWEESLPHFSEQKTFTYQELNDRLETRLEAGTIAYIKMERTSSNRVKQVMIDDQTFTGREIREKLDLRSNDFSIAQNNDHYIFTTKGFGHGVGMSQYGANEMAKLGNSYRDILTYYYQQVEIKPLDNLPKQWAIAFH